MSRLRLSPLYPDTLMVGMELRSKVTQYVKERIGEGVCKMCVGCWCMLHVMPGMQGFFLKEDYCLTKTIRLEADWQQVTSWTAWLE